MRISDWSSDVCSSDLAARPGDLGQDFGKLIALSFDPLFLHDGLACANIGLQLTFGFVELSDFLPMTLKIFVLGGNGLLESAFKLSKAGGRSLRSPRICVCHVELILAAHSWKVRQSVV